MLILPTEKKWFDMILSGEKKDEYREIKPYWIVRIKNWLGTVNSIDEIENLIEQNRIMHEGEVMFRNGYSRYSPSFVAKVSLSIGPGKEEWGATPGVKYFRFHIKEIRR